MEDQVEYIIIALCSSNFNCLFSDQKQLTILSHLNYPDLTVTATKYIVVKVTFLLFHLFGVYVVACVTMNEELGHCGTVMHMCIYILTHIRLDHKAFHHRGGVQNGMQSSHGLQLLLR